MKCNKYELTKQNTCNKKDTRHQDVQGLTCRDIFELLVVRKQEDSIKCHCDVRFFTAKCF